MQCFKNDEGLHRWFEAANYPTMWPVLLREYSKRHLTFDSDGLHAVSGVLENFSRGIEDGFLCGLPVSVLFEASMRWYASAPLRRRGPTADGEDFPSWSWVGWVGEVTYEDYEESDAILDARVISEWVLEHCDGVLRSTDLHFPSASGRLVSSSSEEDLERAKEALRQIETGILRFKTMSAMFAVEETCWNQFVFSNDYDCEYSGLYKVFDKDSWVGSIHLEHAVAKELSVGLGALHEFIVLSKSGGRLQPLKVPVRPLDDDVDDVPLYSENLLKEYGCDVYNVMLVSWEEGVAFRRGIGQIHKASFEHAGWALKDVKLG
ncbi:hypothetical protein CJF30_00009666 [Neofusicoccum parvum]|uniref:Uncharacterized protein n=1 Tax=Neofusicoccum parvum TaxID=310453 RepID=A0ACB5SMM9_9PEZI|nr:hypothetical protein CJF30_00009666 [Neofusicoccum parvum]